MSDPATIKGKILDDKVIDPRGHYAGEIKTGEVFRIIDIEGEQVADFLCLTKSHRHDFVPRLEPIVAGFFLLSQFLRDAFFTGIQRKFAFFLLLI